MTNLILPQYGPRRFHIPTSPAGPPGEGEATLTLAESNMMMRLQFAAYLLHHGHEQMKVLGVVLEPLPPVYEEVKKNLTAAQAMWGEVQREFLTLRGEHPHWEEWRQSSNVYGSAKG